ncbi:hypothetical protein [Paucimonas lemoignei]|nr:hypothetical protein [Paucimonas lemoignei]
MQPADLLHSAEVPHSRLAAIELYNSKNRKKPLVMHDAEGKRRSAWKAV